MIKYLRQNPYAHTPRHHHFFRPISDEIAGDIVAMPGTRTCGEMPGMFFQINRLTDYTQEMNDDIIIGYEQRKSLYLVNLGSSFKNLVNVIQK